MILISFSNGTFNSVTLEPVVLTGDLNVDQRNESYQLIAESGLLSDARERAILKLGDNASFNGFRATLTERDARIIDWM